MTKDELLRVIKQGKAKGLTTLDLHSKQLSELPGEIGQLSQLEVLDLHSNQLSKLPTEIAQLSRLQRLNLYSNQLSELPTEIGQLSQLQRLYLSFNQLSELPTEIAKLSQLQRLYLRNNKLSELPAEIGQLSQLQVLNLSFNQLSELPVEFARLTQLQKLSLDSNQLTELPAGITKLTQLQELCLRNNQLTQLPPKIAKISQLQVLYLRNNKLMQLPAEMGQLTQLQVLDLMINLLPIPPEVLKNTDQPQTIINYYLNLLKTGKKPLHEIKMLLVGEGGVGKTSLVKRLINNSYNSKENTTEGINILPWQLSVNENTIQVNVWDFGGQEIMHATHQFFLTKRSIYILVLNARADEEANRIEYWLKIIDSFSDNSPVIIVRNKIDQGVLDLDIKGLKQKYANIVTFLDTSCETPQGIDQLKQSIIETIQTLKHVNDELPLTWFNIKQKLEECKASKLDYMPYSDYVKLCEAEKIIDREDQKLLIYLLHHLGVILNFQDDPRLSGENVLNPEWVTRAVYKIINDRTLILDYQGALPYSELNRLLDSHSYPPDKHLFLMDIMRKFELCFKMEDNNRYLIPEIIPKQEPETGEWDNCLNIQYHYPVLPNSIISRFIVNTHQYIANKTYWRTGVILKYGKGERENKARIKADKEDRVIFIAIKGNETTRRDFLSIIRSHFERIHQSLPGLVPDIKEYIALPNNSKIIISYNHLLQLEAKGKREYLPENYPEEVNITDLLNGFEEQSKRTQRQSKFTRQEGQEFKIINEINNIQHNPVDNNNINQANSGNGDNVGHDKTVTNPPPQATDDSVTKDNTKAVNKNTLWVIIATVVASVTIVWAMLTYFVDLEIKPRIPETPQTSTK